MSKIIHRLFPKKSFLRNFSVLISTNILISAIGMFTSVYIARVLSPESYGKYGVLISIVSILHVFSSFGLPTTVTREVSRDQDNSSYFLYSSAIGYLFGFILATAIYFLCYVFNVITVENEFHILVLLSLLFSSVWNLIQNVAFGMQRMEHLGIINLLMTILLLFIYIMTPKEYVTLKYVFSISILVQILKDFIFFWSLKNSKLFNSTKSFSFRELISSSFFYIKISFPFLILGFFSMLSNQMPIQFLNINSGVDQVAFFNTANKLLLPVSLVITTAMTAIFPNLSKLYHIDKDSYIKTIRSGFQFLIYFGVFGAIIITLFRNEIVNLVYGEKYANTALVLTYQVWFMVAFAIFNFIGSILSSSDEQKLLSYLSIMYAIVSVSILWFGSFHGAEYISLSFLLASFINLTYHWYFMEKSLSWPFDNKYRLKLLAALLIPGILLSFLPNSISLIIRVIFCVVFVFLIVIVNYRKITDIIKLKFN
jgi:O-antigen/teichoic acid export membrane protein